MTRRNYFSLKTMFWGGVPLSHTKMRLKSTPQKLNFLMEKCTQERYTLNCSRKCPCTFSYVLVTHCSAQLHILSAQLRIVTPPRFREKPFYVEQITFSTVQRTKKETKPKADAKSTQKINMTSRQAVLQILRISAVICI